MPVSEDAGARLRDNEEGMPLIRGLQHEQPHALEVEPAAAAAAGTPAGTPARQLVQRVRAWARGFTPELAAIALIYLTQGVLKLSSLAVTFFLKDDLGLQPAQLALAETISGLPWATKPVYGFITDSFPICGLRRRPYLILAGLLGSTAWLCMAGLANSVGVAVACMTTAALATAFSDVVADSIVVQLARESPGQTEGGLQAMCWGAHAFGRVLTAYLSGWLLGKVGPRLVFLATATFPLIVCLSSCLINEQAAGSSGKGSAGAAAGAPAATDAGEEGSGEQQRLLSAAEPDSAAAAAATNGNGSRLGSGLEKKHSNLPESSGELAGGSGSGSGSWQQPAQRADSDADPALVLLSSEHQLTQGTLHHKHRQQAPRPSPFGVRGAQQQQQELQQSSRLGGPAAAAGGAAGAAAGNTAATGSFSLRIDLGVGSGSGSSSCGQVFRAGWVSMCRSARLLWGALKQPHLLRPVAFLFLLQAMPQPDSAMFFFKSNQLHFDAEFFGRVKLVAALADLAGLAIYNAFLRGARLRRMLLWGSLLGVCVGLTPLLLVEGVNRRLGIPDRVFALVDSALLASIGQVLLMPTLVLCARLCPEGVEATLYAALMSVNNAASGVASALGAAMTGAFGITSTNFQHLSALLITCNVLSLLPLPLVRWVPDDAAPGSGGGDAGGGGAATPAGEEEEEGAVARSGRPGR